VMFLEASAIDYSSLKYLPSTQAFAAVILAFLTCHAETCTKADHVWPKALAQVTQTSYQAILPCATDMLRVATNFLGTSSKYQATRRKFNSGKYLEVAAQTLPAEVPTYQME